MRDQGELISDPESAGGHYLTSGAAITSLGAFGLVIALISTLILKIDVEVIDGRGMALTSVGLIAVGGWLIGQGKALQRGR